MKCIRRMVLQCGGQQIRSKITPFAISRMPGLTRSQINTFTIRQGTHRSRTALHIRSTHTLHPDPVGQLPVLIRNQCNRHRRMFIRIEK